MTSSNSGRESTLYPSSCTVGDFQLNYRAVVRRIEAACLKAGRNPLQVRLLPVSKTQNESTIRTAHVAGLSWFGENKVQEAQRKARAMSDLPDLRWAMIGHLQTNKARQVARFASEFHGLDSLRVAQALDIGLQLERRQLDVYVQVNTSMESSKHGLHPDGVADFLSDLQGFRSLRVRGLMTMAMLTTDTGMVRECFARLRRCRDSVKSQLPSTIRVDELSMGMSGDLEIAIEEGSTVVRVGQALFGPRALNDSSHPPEELPL